MTPLTLTLIVLAASAGGLIAISLLVESLRKEPTPPTTLRWAPEIPIHYVEVNGSRLRYIKAGSGPTLVLLHTLRTQLDLFQKVLPELAKSFTVYAFDYPGHGFSDIPQARYDAAFFADSVEGFLEELDLREVTLAGVSIGGAIPLILAGRRNPRLRRVVAINPYDYAKGRGLGRSSFLGRMIMMVSLVPVLGETITRLRDFKIMKAVFEGGVADPKSLPADLLEEMYVVGNRAGHYRAFLKLLRRAASWEEETTGYSNIRVPCLLIWGDEDWSRPDEREHDRQLVPGAEMVSVSGGGHFLPLDKPHEVINYVRDLASRALPATDGRDRAM